MLAAILLVRLALYKIGEQLMMVQALKPTNYGLALCKHAM